MTEHSVPITDAYDLLGIMPPLQDTHMPLAFPNAAALGDFLATAATLYQSDVFLKRENCQLPELL